MRYPVRGTLLPLFLASLLCAYLAPGVAADAGFAPVAGGWSTAPLQDESVRRAAQFALQEQGRQSRTDIRLLAIKHARQQVVAGTNYSMNLMVQSEGKRRLVIAEVWAKQDGSLQLTRWHWV